MATVSRSSTKQLRGPAQLFVASHGTWPSEALGYTDGPLEITVDQSYEEDEAQEVLEPISSVLTSRRVTLAAKLKQVEPDVISRILGITPSDLNLALTGDPEELELAVLAVCTRDDKAPVYVYLPRVKSEGGLSLAIGRGKSSPVDFSVKTLYEAGGYIRFALAVATATIATGAAARVNTAPTTQIAHIKLAGESAAADTLDDITLGATALADGEIVRLQIAAIAAPITVKHAAGVIALTGAADFVMTKLADWVDLRYDLAGTVWNEIARHDAA